MAQPISLDTRRQEDVARPKPEKHGRARLPTPNDSNSVATGAPAVVKLLLTPQEAADALAINRSTLYQLIMCGAIPSLLIGRARRIPVHVLEQWIANQISA